MRIIKELEEVRTARQGQWRVVIVERDDGFYAYAEQYYYVSEYDGEIISEGWHTLACVGIYENPQVAEHEGRSALESCKDGEGADYGAPNRL